MTQTQRITRDVGIVTRVDDDGDVRRSGWVECQMDASEVQRA